MRHLFILIIIFSLFINCSEETVHDPTTIIVPIEYPDNSMDGKTVYILMSSYDNMSYSKSKVKKSILKNGKIEVQFEISGSNINKYNKQLKASIKAFITENSNDMNINDVGLLTGYCIKTLPKIYYYSIKGSEKNILNNPPITFDDGFDIRIEPSGLREKYPTIRWNDISDCSDIEGDTDINKSKYFIEITYSSPYFDEQDYIYIEGNEQISSSVIYTSKKNRSFLWGDGSPARNLVERTYVQNNYLTLNDSIQIPNNSKVYIEILSRSCNTRYNFSIARATFVK